jgi:adenylate cyclase
LTEIVDELSWRLVASGSPLMGVSFHSETLHPQFLGATYLWWRDLGQTYELMIEHEIAGRTPYEKNAVRRVREGGETLRRRLEGGAPSEFPILEELRAFGATEYYALPVPSLFGFSQYVASFATDRPGGFSDSEAADLAFLSRGLSVIADMNSQRKIAENVLRAYLGPQTGLKVLAGKIRRGSGETISAVLWSSDVRGFTRLSEKTSGDRLIEILNEVFDLQAVTIARHGGEILKFVGDGLVAIFPVPTPSDLPEAAARALAAARETQSALSARTSRAGEETIRIAVALHHGEVIYGNVGAAERLDFTVIGPAVNLVSRIEAVAKSLDLPIVVSDDFAEAHGGEMRSIGMHELRGLDRQHELFVPEE